MKLETVIPPPPVYYNYSLLYPLGLMHDLFIFTKQFVTYKIFEFQYLSIFIFKTVIHNTKFLFYRIYKYLQPDI